MACGEIGPHTVTLTATNIHNHAAAAMVVVMVVGARPIRPLPFPGGILPIPPLLRRQLLARHRRAPGNQQVKTLELAAFPNPAQTNVEFTPAEEGTFRLAVYDREGKLVQEVAAGKGSRTRFFSYEVPTGNLPEGGYLIQLTPAGGIASKRLVIKR